MNLYVLGDVSSFVAALNSLVMILGVQSFIGGAALVGALVGLLGFLIFLMNKDAGSSIIPGGSPIVALIVFFIFFTTLGIKTKVTITDVYTGNTNIVDNVPALVSMPASAISTAAYKIFDLSNTAFQGTNGSYMALGSTGFVAPLQILSTLRNGIEGLDPLLAGSTKQFIIDCIPGGAVNPEAMASSKDVMAYVLSTARDNGMTTTFTAAAPSGTATSCFQQKTDLAAREDAYLSTPDAHYGNQSKLVAMVNQSTKQKNPSGNAVSKTDIDAAVNNVILSALPNIQQNADQFMMNSLMYNTLNNTFNCLDQAGTQAGMSSCDIMMTQANEQWKTDAAASGSLFSKTMMPAMVFMQLMFYSLAPIVIVFGLLRGAGAIPMYVKYLGFGVWTASWMPVAAVIQMYIQNNVAGKLAQISAGGLTMGNFHAINYDVISTNLAIASDMLAATPLVTATILGVSGMAISQLANNMGGKDRVDEKVATPDIMKNSPLVQGSSMSELNANTHMATKTGAAEAPKLTFTSANSQAITSADTTRNTDTAAIAADTSKSLGAIEQRMISTINSNGQTVSENGSTGYRVTNGQSLKFASGVTEQQGEAAMARAAVSAEAGIALGATINAALVPEIIKAAGKDGVKVSEAEAAKMIEASAAKASAKDAGFFSKLASGDEAAMDSLIGGIVEVAADAATVAAEVGTLGGGTPAAVAGQAVFRAGGKQAAVGWIKKAVHGLGGAADKMKGVSSAIFDQTKMSAQTTMRDTLSAQSELANNKAETIQQVATSMTDWTRQDFQSGDTTTSKTHGSQNSDASQKSTSAAVAEVFKSAQQRTEMADQSYQRSAAQAFASGTKQEMSAQQFIQYMRDNPEQARALQARADALEPLIAKDAAYNRSLIDNSVIAGATEKEKNFAAAVIAMATAGETNLIGGPQPSNGLKSDSNAGLTKPQIDQRIATAAANVPQPNTIAAPDVHTNAPASGRQYNQAPITGTHPPANPSPQAAGGPVAPASSTAPATPPHRVAAAAPGEQSSPAIRPEQSTPIVASRNNAPDQPAPAAPGRPGSSTPVAQPAAQPAAQASAQPAAQQGHSQPAHHAPALTNGQPAAHNEHVAGAAPREPAQARAAQPAHAPAKAAANTPPAPQPNPVPLTRPSMDALKARSTAENAASIDEMKGTLHHGPVAMQELKAPDANKLSMGDVNGQVLDTGFGKGVAITTAAVGVLNMGAGALAPDKDKDKKGAKPGAPGEHEPAPGAAPNAPGSPNSPGSAATAKPQDTKRAALFKPKPQRRTRG